jgi:hypothetical protein
MPRGLRGLPIWLFVLAIFPASICFAETATTKPAIPTPASQAADIFISGRTFKAIHVDVADIDQALPDTFAGIKLSNTKGFIWYVSRHYALKTDVKESKAHDFLELLECAYPYYVHFFGAEPEGIANKRLPIVFSKDKKGLERAMKSDDIKWDFTGGGITYERIHIAYAYPSGSLDYHQRYILLHECTHLFQMCLTGRCDNTPLWYCEGIADAISSHVYDKESKRVTLDVLDKGVIPNFLDNGLESLRKKPRTIHEIDVDTKVSRGAGFVLTQFLRSSPAGEKKFRLWADKMMRGPFKDNTDPDARADREMVLEKYFGPLEKLDGDFLAWCKARRNTFHYVEWGWEQDGNALVAYGFAENGRLSQTDLLLPPGEKPTNDPWRLDYPADALPPTVGPIARGVAEPSIGALLDFREDPHRGLAGIGLGVMSPSDKSADGLHADHGTQFKVLVRQGKFLELDGSDLSLKTISLPIPADVQSAMDADQQRIGLTVTIAKTELRATVRSRNPKSNHIAEFTATMPIDSDVRKRLLEDRLSILARDGWQRITPFFDEGPRKYVDPPPVSPIGRWRNSD